MFINYFLVIYVLFTVVNISQLTPMENATVKHNPKFNEIFLDKNKIPFLAICDTQKISKPDNISCSVYSQLVTNVNNKNISKTINDRDNFLEKIKNNSPKICDDWSNFDGNILSSQMKFLSDTFACQLVCYDEEDNIKDICLSIVWLKHLLNNDEGKLTKNGYTPIVSNPNPNPNPNITAKAKQNPIAIQPSLIDVAKANNDRKLVVDEILKEPVIQLDTKADNPIPNTIIGNNFDTVVINNNKVDDKNIKTNDEKIIKSQESLKSQESPIGNHNIKSTTLIDINLQKTLDAFNNIDENKFEVQPDSEDSQINYDLDNENDNNPSNDVAMKIPGKKIFINNSKELAKPIVGSGILSDPFLEENDNESNFFVYSLCGMLGIMLAYIFYHNKTKLLALLLEGRRTKSNRNGRRKHNASYRKLDTNLEEAITSSSTGRSTQIIY